MNEKSLLNRTNLNYLFSLVLFVIPFILLILPADLFDNRPSICLSRVLFDFECYGCGLTRGIMHIIHFDFETAWKFNKLSFIVFPLMGLYWLKAAFVVFKKEVPSILKKIT